MEKRFLFLFTFFFIPFLGISQPKGVFPAPSYPFGKTHESVTTTTSSLTNPAVAVSPKDSLVLVALYEATGGDQWKNHDHWLTDSVYKWYGITLNDNGQVVEIQLMDNHLTGTLPEELGELPDLLKINLKINQLSGFVPATLGNPEHLEYLDLSRNQLEGKIPPELGNLEALTWLNLSNNLLTGEIPEELGGLISIRTLDLSDNQLEGKIPPSLGNLPDLMNLDLSYNRLSGEIPPELGKLASLWYLKLDFNELEGEIPPELGDLSELIRLSLSRNRLTGKVPAELQNLSRLNYLILSDNQLTGGFTDDIQNMQSLKSLVISDNLFTDLPDLSGLPLQNCDVRRNHLDFGDLENTGLSADDLFYAPQLPVSVTREDNGTSLTFSVSVDGTDNKYAWYNLDDRLPGEEDTALTVSPDATGGYYCQIVNARYPDLTLYSFVETVGDAPVLNGVKEDEAKALISLYKALEGDQWRKNTNWLSSGPAATWFGVTVEGVHVTALSLSNNGLAGKLPPDIGALSYLRELFLGSNALTGEIPTELGQLSELTYLTLASNQLTGSIPKEIGRLTHLRLISLSENQLTGSIPSQLGDLPDLFYISLDKNQLTGSIPPELGNLKQLETLDLAENQLAGSIPPELGNATALFRLDLNDNHLTGSLPGELANINNLYYLILTNNDLSEIGDDVPDGLAGIISMQNNRLTFEDLENHLSLAKVSFWYTPQKKVGNSLDTLLRTGTSYVMRAEVGGEHNLYQWFFNGDTLAGATADTLMIRSFTSDSAGTYICRITNTVVPDLILETEPMILRALLGIRVQVTDGEQPLEEVLVTAGDEADTTDANGEGELELVAGTYVVTVTKEGYNAFSDTVSFSRDTVLTFELTPATGIPGQPASSLRVYPNPSSGVITVELPRSLRNGSLRIFSMNGALRTTQPVNSRKQIKFHLEDLPPGLYILEVWEENDILWRQKLLIR